MTELTAMSAKPRRLFLIFLAVVLGLYALGPIIAAAVDYSDRRGPRIYPRGYHEVAFIVSYAVFCQGEKPRVPFDRDRAWFYGMERPLNQRAGR